jgi:hypothetical protein
MALVNAALVFWGGGPPRFVTNAPSIAVHGRKEGKLDLSGVETWARASEIATGWLADHSQVREATAMDVVVSGGRVPMQDYGIGDLGDFGGLEAAVERITLTGQQPGLLAPELEVKTLTEWKQMESERAIRRLTRSSSAEARTAINAAIAGLTGSDLKPERVRLVSLTEWSWFEKITAEDLGDWMRQPGKVPMRLWKWEMNANGDGTGNTRFILARNGADIDPPFILQLGPTDTHVEQFIYGPATVYPTDLIYPRCIGWGEHTKGSITIHAVTVGSER